MKKYFSKIGTSSSSSPKNIGASSTIPSMNFAIPNVDFNPINVSSNLEVQSDSGLRKSIQSYDPNDRE
ncbi:hypothetical protein LguiA_016609 [Lonicera macranthoides]